MNSGRPVVRIAHAYGNRRETLRQALAADVDMIEADLWFRAGRIEVRHERRLGRLPVLADRRPRGVSPLGPWALPLPRRLYLRFEPSPLLLDELLETTAGEKGLLLDVKAVDAGPAEAFAEVLVREIEAASATTWAAVCGQSWPVLDRLRGAAPDIEVRYSMQRQRQWEAYLRRLGQGNATPRVCVEHRMMDIQKAAFLETSGVDVYCWTVDDARAAATLVGRGVEGIISNGLELLAGLRSPPQHHEE